MKRWCYSIALKLHTPRCQHLYLYAVRINRKQGSAEDMVKKIVESSNFCFSIEIERTVEIDESEYQMYDPSARTFWRMKRNLRKIDRKYRKMKPENQTGRP